MKTLDRYIWKKFFVSFLGSLLLLIIVLVAIDVAEKIDDFVERQVPIQALWQYYQNFIPFYANLLSPLVVFIAVLFFTGQMAQRSEIVALMGGGESMAPTAPLPFSRRAREPHQPLPPDANHAPQCPRH